jgi:hypothetical protein
MFNTTIAESLNVREMIDLLLSEQREHYSQVSTVAVDYFGDNPMLRKRRFRDLYYTDEGTISIITSIQQKDYDLDVIYNETSLRDYVEFMDRLKDKGYVIEIKRRNFTRVIPRIPPSNTPYPSYIPFTYENVVDFYQSGNSTLQSKTDPDWSLFLELEDGNYYIHTLYQDYLHGPVYIINFSEPEYLGSYNYGYKDGLWIVNKGNKKVVYSKGIVVYEKKDDGEALISAYPETIAPYIENSSLLLYSPTEQEKPQVIDNVIITQVVEYY